MTAVRDPEELRRYVEDGQQVAGPQALLSNIVDGAVSALRDDSASPRGPDCFAVMAPPDVEAVAAAPAGCGCVRGPRETRFHQDVQDTSCDAWKQLVELVEEAARDGRAEFNPRAAMDAESWARIVTLPASLAKLKAVRSLMLYGSHLVRIPPEIGQMTSLEKFTPYTSYGLHWFPYEITRCKNLTKSTVSTRALYGNYKYRPQFPNLKFERGPSGQTCSVCDRAAPPFRQVWISLRVATDVLPLLVNACSDECVGALPGAADGYVPMAHRGGTHIEQPPADSFYSGSGEA